jgi:TolB-like protein
MKQFALSIALLVCVGQAAGYVHPQVTLDQRIGELSKQISDGLTENQKQTIAVVEFADLRGNVTDFGRFISEELITRLYQTKKFKVIERQLLNKVIAEQKLSLTGVIEQTAAQRLGKVLGVDAIASGTVTDLGKILRVNARLISTGTGEVFAVAVTEIAKDDSVLALMGAGNTGPTNTSSSSAPSYQGNAIASKDIGSLRVVLKSVLPLKLKAENGQSLNGIRCSFEFINLDIQRSLVVAANAEAGRQPGLYATGGGTTEGSALGDLLRTTLVDDRGTVWKLYRSGVSNVTGLGVVSPGRSQGQAFSPSEIPDLLKRQEATDTSTFRDRDNIFVWGSTTPIPPGQSVSVMMNFREDKDEATLGAPPTFFQFNGEIVVGIVTTGTKKSYSLHNFTFDRVSLSAGAR